jgi:RNA polymerase sigma factor (sigma-70 family)
MLTADRSRGEDALVYALARAYLAWPRLHDKSDVEAYILQILVKGSVSRLRPRLRRRSSYPPGSQEPTESAPSAAVEDPSFWNRLRELPARQRTVAVLRYYEDLTELETARILGCSVDRVNRYAAQALATLRTSAAPVEARHHDRRSDGPPLA